MTNSNIVALIVAAGRGERTQKNIPKQYTSLAGKAVLRHSLDIFLSAEKISNVAVVINAQHEQEFFRASQGCEKKLLPPIHGGSTRQESVFAGLKAIQYLNPTHVIIHDAARPLVTQQDIENIFNELKIHQAVICASPITDTIKQVENDTILKTHDRSKLWAAETPQGFQFEKLYQLHEKAYSENYTCTDDASLFEKEKLSVKIISSSRKNMKLTYPEDFKMVEALMSKSKKTITGFGYDIHAFAEGNFITLCGLKIPHTRGIDAHSDGDVALHALCDAIFGAIGDGDIGTHFPPSNEQWKNASSIHFLKYALNRLRSNNFQLIHCDITILAEEPKISSYRSLMIEKLAEQTSLPQTSIGLKATTCEGLGAIGNREGIAAMVTVTIEAIEI